MTFNPIERFILTINQIERLFPPFGKSSPPGKKACWTWQEQVLRSESEIFRPGIVSPSLFADLERRVVGVAEAARRLLRWPLEDTEERLKELGAKRDRLSRWIWTIYRDWQVNKNTDGADTSADTKRKKRTYIPRDRDILKLANKLNLVANSGRSENDIALEFAEGNERRAKSLLRGVRRWRASQV